MELDYCAKSPFLKGKRSSFSFLSRTATSHWPLPSATKMIIQMTAKLKAISNLSETKLSGVDATELRCRTRALIRKRTTVQLVSRWDTHTQKLAREKTTASQKIEPSCNSLEVVGNGLLETKGVIGGRWAAADLFGTPGPLVRVLLGDERIAEVEEHPGDTHDAVHTLHGLGDE